MTRSEQKQDPYNQAEEADRESRKAVTELRATKKAFERLLGLDKTNEPGVEAEGSAKVDFFIETHTIFFGGIYPHLTHVTKQPHDIEPQEVFYIGPLETKHPALTGESGFLLRFSATNLSDRGTHNYVMWLSRLTSDGNSYAIQTVGVRPLDELPEEVELSEHVV